MDYLFVIAYILEISLRMYAWGCRGYWILHDSAWNWFDCSIVSVTTLALLLPTAMDGSDSPMINISAFRVLRTVRFARAFRFMRVMKFFKDARVLIAAIASSFKTARTSP